MDLDHVVLNVAVGKMEDLSRVDEVLSSLNLTFKADYDGFLPDYRKEMTDGRVEVSYINNGFVREELRGEFVNICVKRREGHRPSVRVVGIDGLGEEDNVCYENGALSIIREGEKPIRYLIQSGA